MLKNNTKKRFLALWVSAVFLLIQTSTFSTVYAAPKAPKLVEVYLNGNQLQNYDVPPQIIYDYCYVPMAQTIQDLTGTRPTWDDATKTEIFYANNKRVTIKLNEKRIFVDGVEKKYDTPATLVDGRLLCPLKMISDATGLISEWDAVNYQVRLKSKQTPTQTTAPTQTPKPAQTTAPVATPTPSNVLPEILTVGNSNITVERGREASFTATASNGTTKLKVVNASGATVYESTQFISTGSSRAFSLTFLPTVSGTYKVYAGNATLFNEVSYRVLTINVGEPPKITSITTVPATTVSVGDNVTVTVTANSGTESVKLVNDSNTADFVETKTFSLIDNQRVFTFVWNIKNVNSKSATVYVGDAKGAYTFDSKKLNLNVSSQAAASILNLNTSATSVRNGETLTITLVTNTSAKSVWIYDEYSGVTYGTTSTYSESNGRRTFTINWLANTTVGPKSFRAYAADSNSSSVYLNFAVTVNEAQISNSEIISSQIDVSNPSAPVITVLTSNNVDLVWYSYAGGSGTYTSGNQDGNNRKLFTLFCPPGITASSQVTINARTTNNQIITRPLGNNSVNNMNFIQFYNAPTTVIQGSSVQIIIHTSRYATGVTLTDFYGYTSTASVLQELPNDQRSWLVNYTPLAASRGQSVALTARAEFYSSQTPVTATHVIAVQ